MPNRKKKGWYKSQMYTLDDGCGSFLHLFLSVSVCRPFQALKHTVVLGLLTALLILSAKLREHHTAFLMVQTTDYCFQQDIGKKTAVI